DAPSDGQSIPALSPRRSNVNLFRYCKCIVDFDAKISHRTFDSGVAEQELNRSQVSCATVDQGRLGASERVGAIDVRVQSYAGNPLGNETCILSSGHALAGLSPTREQKLAGLLASGLQVVVEGLAGLLRQFEADWVPGLSLPHSRSGEGIAVGGHIL